LRASTIMTIGRAAQLVAGGALPVTAKAGAAKTGQMMSERTRDMPAKDST